MGFLSDIFGSKIKLPEYQQLDIGAEQKKTVTDNLAALPEAQKLAEGVNTFSEQQLHKMWQNVMPLYDEMLGQVSGNLMSQLKGEIPQDVQNSIVDQNAAWGVGSGVAGSGVQRQRLGRSLGLTSLDISRQAVSSVSQWLSTLKGTSMPQMMSPTTMMLTPEQRYAMVSNEHLRKYQSDVQVAVNNAAPDPVTRGIWQEFQELAETAAGFGMSSMGGGGGGGKKEKPYSSTDSWTPQDFRAYNTNRILDQWESQPY